MLEKVYFTFLPTQTYFKHGRYLYLKVKEEVAINITERREERILDFAVVQAVDNVHIDVVL